MKRFLVLIIMVCFFLCVPAVYAGIKAGDVELGVAASFSKTDFDYGRYDADTTTLTIDFSVATFITEEFSAGINIAIADLSNGFDETTLGFEGELNYHFIITPDHVPYFGAHAGWTKWDIEDADDTALSYGAQIGIKFFLRENVALKVEGRYDTMEFDDSDLEVDNLGTFVGFLFIF